MTNNVVWSVLNYMFDTLVDTDLNVFFYNMINTISSLTRKNTADMPMTIQV